MKLLLGLFSLTLLLSSCHDQDKIKPSIEDISESVYASGVVKSKNQYQAYSTVNGIVKVIYVTEGQEVRKGMPIVKIFNRPSALNANNAKLAAEYASLATNQGKLEELKMAIALAKSKMENYSLLLQRQESLWRQNIGSKMELEQRELTYKNSATNYRSDVLRYNNLFRDLNLNAHQSKNIFEINSTLANEYIIKSEIDGTIYSLLKEQGEIVNSQTPVALIGDQKDFFLELQVDENDIFRIQKDQKVMVGLESYKGEVFEAVVSTIEPAMNERSKQFTVNAVFTRQPAILYPFLSAEANILIATKEDAMTIPRSYLIDESFVLTDKQNRKKKVVTGLKDYQKVEILSGLQRDESILKPE
jgi:multidrug efflux pump subunit AcrA (membrane-fusion protein)